MGNLLTHKVIFNPRLHASQGYLALARGLSEPPGSEPLLKTQIDPVLDTRIRIDPPEESLTSMRNKIAGLYPSITDQFKLVILNANASDIIAFRRWPEENFFQLAGRLLEKENLLIILTGTEKERERAEKLKSGLNNGRIVNLAGLTTLHELMALYKISDLLITNDSGPGHFSSAVEIPAVILFGPETPKAWGPLNPHAHVIYRDLACSPCVSPHNHKQSPCTDNQCMKQITVDEVFLKAEKLLIDL